MGIWNFSKQFAPKVRTGEKTMTIRARRKDGKDPLPGTEQALYEGLRTKKSNLIKKVTILSRTPVIINIDEKRVYVNNVNLLFRHIRKLAKDDGFDSVDSFFDWFGKKNVKHFDGFIYKW